MAERGWRKKRTAGHTYSFEADFTIDRRFSSLVSGDCLGVIRFTDSTVPWLDSLTTALSITAMWMLAYKQAEQWLVWVVVDIVSCALYVYKGLPFYAGLYGFYTFIAFFGYLKWRKMIVRSF